MPKKPLHEKYGSTLFIFPVFLPLAELLPWLLTVIGALAGMFQLITHSLWRNTVARNTVWLLCLGCFATAGIMTWQRISNTPQESMGSEIVTSEDYSRLESFAFPPLRQSVSKNQSITLLWTTNSPHQNIGKPIVSGNLLMVGTYKGTLDALSITDGMPIWTLHKQEQIFSTPAVSGPYSFVGEGHHTSPSAVLTSQSFPDGKVLWERKFRSHIESYPVMDAKKNRLWLGAGETGIWALNTSDGSVLWWKSIGHTDIPPLFQDGRLFAAVQPKTDINGTLLVELDPDTGMVFSSTPVPGNPMGNLIAGLNEEMYLATAIGQVGAAQPMDAGWVHGFTEDGKLRWTTKLTAMPLPEGIMLADKSLLFYTLKDGSLIALRTKDGSVAWQVKAGRSFATDATLITRDKGPVIAAITSEGLVTLRNALTGEEINHFNVEAGDSYPLYKDGILYITTPYNVRAYAGMQGL